MHSRRNDRLEALRARIRRSLDDPRPSLTEDAVDARMKELFDRTVAVRPSTSLI
jgi:hypothetical protein